MSRAPQDVTDEELCVLQSLWANGPMTVRQIANELYPGGGSSEYATVQKLLERLRRKEYVSRNRDVWPHLFAAEVDRDELISRRLQTAADQLCNGSLQPLIMTLVKSQKLSAEERTTLRGLLDDIDAGLQQPGGK